MNFETENQNSRSICPPTRLQRNISRLKILCKHKLITTYKHKSGTKEAEITNPRSEKKGKKKTEIKQQQVNGCRFFLHQKN